MKQPGKLDKVCRSVKVKGTVSGEVLGVTILLGLSVQDLRICRSQGEGTQKLSQLVLHLSCKSEIISKSEVRTC